MSRFGGSELILVVPAYRPTRALIEVVSSALTGGFTAAIVVDDGSGPEFETLFQEVARLPGARLVRHAVNLGKGHALKTGINLALVEFLNCDGIVTADADGQHLPEDIAKVASELAAHPGSLILGARSFSSRVPLRSRFGNVLTKHLLRYLVGSKLTDTQTGLRGIPSGLARLILRIPTAGYDFELDVLVRAKHHSIPIREVPVNTVYLNGNATSHFRPLWDSMKVYFVLLRFGGLAVLTAVLDNLVFYLFFIGSGQIAASQAVARAVALAFNYIASRNVVFLSKHSHGVVLPRYVVLVAVSGLCSYLLIRGLITAFAIEVVLAKVVAESILFIANFAILRDFVFRRKDIAESSATDWTQYYENTPPTARASRKYTTSRLLRLLRRCGAGPESTLIELGGANSCFLDRILAEIRPRRYRIVDNNRYGLDLLKARTNGRSEVSTHEADVTRLDLDVRGDIVFSVGLIEHFAPATTREVIQAHFDLAGPGGFVLISFPTPTVLYRAARFVAEAGGWWKFPDERPLHASEVREAIGNRGAIIEERMLWPIVFTQRMILVRVNSNAAAEQRAGSSRIGVA